jgi:hypothetical protein
LVVNVVEKILTKLGLNSNWPLLRKFETLVFAAMLALLPFFAFKVVSVTNASLAVKNTTVDLVKDLRRARQLAKEHGVRIALVSRQENKMEASAYLIEDDQRTIEEIVLPRGVTVTGMVKFDAHGIPLEPASFNISKALKQSKVIVDANGIISAP